FGRQRDPAAHALSVVDKVYLATQFVRNEVANGTRAIPRLGWSRDGRTSTLDPFQQQAALAILPIPPYRDASVRRRQRTILGGIGYEFMQHDRHGLGGIRRQKRGRTFNARAILTDIGRQFAIG